MTAKPRSQHGRRPSHRSRRSTVAPGEDDGRKHISATERWVKISRRVYSKAQQRGFVGGDPLADLSEAVREIDGEYITDVSGLLALTDPAEMREQLRSLFASYGLGRQSLERLLDKNRDKIEKLARLNRVPARRPEQGARRKSLLKSTANQAINSLQELADEVDDRTRNIPLIGTSTHAAHTIISSLTRLAGSAGEVAGVTARRPGRRQRELEVHTMVVKAYAGHTPAELADAPVAALRGVSAATARKLKSALGMASIRDMATSQIFERADGVVTLADAEGDGSAATRKTPRQLSSLRQLASGPIADMRGVTPHQARVLEHTLKITTVRDLAGNRFFRLARAIVALADADLQSN